MGDAVSVRYAAQKLFDGLPPTDRVGIFTSSGQVSVDFTSDRLILKDSLSRIVPRPLVGSGSNANECPSITFYQARQIIEFHDATAQNVAESDVIACLNTNQPPPPTVVESMVRGKADSVLSSGEAQTEMVYRNIEAAMRRLAAMPGQRVLVFVSPGFVLTLETREQGDLIERANRSSIVINTIDARGLYAPDLFGDISRSRTHHRKLRASVRNSVWRSNSKMESSWASSPTERAGPFFTIATISTLECSGR